MGEEKQLIVRVVPSIGDVDADKWDACASPEGRPYNPFTSHAFLYALERSQCATPYEGWAPQHLCLESGDGTLLGCMPNYLKSNSYGEYIFDHGWADAFESAGGHYYPKLQSAVPFTPAQGRRLLVAPGPQEVHFEKLLASAAIELMNFVCFMCPPASAQLSSFCSNRPSTDLANNGSSLGTTSDQMKASAQM